MVGTGSSRKSATNSVLWFMGDDIPFVPNKRGGGLCLGGKIAPIFFNTMEDAGALPVEVDVSRLNMGDVIDVYPYKGEVRSHETGELLANFELKTDVLIDEVRAGGRIPLIIGRGLTTKAREALGCRTARYSVRRKTWRKVAAASLWRRKWSVAPAASLGFVRARTASRK
nr:bifunctional aconitate hydratase 2/2-methylisocitrate dehydratase [Salmonella sp. NCTC 7297]